MSQDIIKEVFFLFHSFVLGVIITFVYDWLLILRRMIKHNIFFISLEDFFFWVLCAISVFSMLYEENNGTLRWFAVAGAFLGMIIYKKTVSRPFVKIGFGVLSKITEVVGKGITLLLRPVLFFIKKSQKTCVQMGHKGGRIGKYVKNRLTSYGKVLKMILCKR